MWNKLNNKLTYHIIVTILFLVVVFIFVDYNEVDIFNQEGLKISNYDDGETIGNSKSELINGVDGVSLEYVLGDKAPYPFAGFKLSPSGSIDLSHKDFIEVELDVSRKGRMHVFFSTKTHSDLTQKFMIALDCTPEQKLYRLSFKEFVTPTWWYKNNKVSQSDYNAYDLSRVVSLCVENDVWVQKETKHSFTLKGLKSLVNNKPVYCWGICCLLMLNLIGLLLFRLNRKKKVEINYKAIDYKKTDYLTKSDLSEVIDYINLNYNNPDLTLKVMKSELKIPENKISALIKDEFGVSYKDYVHSIRITESKRFLETTDLNINEVADVVGYGSISTFNRVFKEKEGLTPSEYLSSLKN